MASRKKTSVFAAGCVAFLIATESSGVEVGCYAMDYYNDTNSLWNDGLITTEQYEAWMGSFGDNFGGVTLDKTLTLLNDVADIKGAAYDARKGEVVFIGRNAVPVAERIDLDDLVVAARSVFGVDANGYSTDPGVSFEATPSWQVDGKHKVVFKGATRDTQFGKILYEADYILKKLGQGVDEQRNLLRNNPALSALGYVSSAERFLSQNIAMVNNAGQPLGLEYYFAPKSIVLSACDPALNAACSRQSFVFSEMSMELRYTIRNPDGSVAQQA